MFVDGTGAARLFYGELVARDAKGKELESTARGRVGRVQIRVRDEARTYPITIDPLIQPAAWSVESNVASAHWSDSVATAGDVNSDGYSDVIVGSGELAAPARRISTWAGAGGLVDDSDLDGPGRQRR